MNKGIYLDIDTWIVPGQILMIRQTSARVRETVTNQPFRGVDLGVDLNRSSQQPHRHSRQRKNKILIS